MSGTDLLDRGDGVRNASISRTLFDSIRWRRPRRRAMRSRVLDRGRSRGAAERADHEAKLRRTLEKSHGRLDPATIGKFLIVGKSTGLFPAGLLRCDSAARRRRHAAAAKARSKARQARRWEPVVISPVFPRGPLELPSLGFLERKTLRSPPAEATGDAGENHAGGRRSELVEGRLLVGVDLEDLVEPGDAEDLEEVGVDAAELELALDRATFFLRLISLPSAALERY